ncbi:hypothetical protein GQ53DRAFT_745780 [Thozetella sp. PMI_491]|nr:hypothetical protein GQ53DRAFT_745780 [Thozetella sp. PMI_491]
MSIRIALEDAPEFYTNLDVVRGRVVIMMSRYEQVGAIIVKLEGESNTALTEPNDGTRPTSGGNTLHENHKVLYKVAQVFPDETASPMAGPLTLAPGQHQFPFQFKLPFNNACSDPAAMARIGGLAGAGGYASGSGLLGLGGIRVMDGSKQLMYRHVTKTLPPSFTGFPRQAEIRYYIKVTIQRPGLFKENWRYQVGFKFLPIEMPRPPKTNQEAYARRPFIFRPRSNSPGPDSKKRSSFLAGRKASSGSVVQGGGSSSAADGTLQPAASGGPPGVPAPPSVEMSARLPHPSIITCNQPIPLRLIAKKLNHSTAEIYLISLQIDLIGRTLVRAQDLQNAELTRWVIVSRHGLSIPVSRPDAAPGTETIIPDTLWRDIPLPNTVMPTFVTCNLSRSYQLEVKVGLSWGKPGSTSAASNLFKGKSRVDPSNIPQELHLPLHFSAVDVYSGLAPPAQLVEAMRRGRTQRPGQTNLPAQRPPMNRPQTAPAQRPPSQVYGQQPPGSQAQRPPLPARPSAPPAQQEPPSESLYPPQLQPGDIPPYDDAPPSYDEAMAESAGPVFADGRARPAYSGVTNENEPSLIQEKR